MCNNEKCNNVLETFVVHARGIHDLMYALTNFLKALIEAKSAKHLKNLSSVSKLVNFVDMKTLKKSSLGISQQWVLNSMFHLWMPL